MHEIYIPVHPATKLLSTPSLGITCEEAEGDMIRLEVHFQLPLSGSLRQAVGEIGRGPDTLAFNSLSRDHWPGDFAFCVLVIM